MQYFFDETIAIIMKHIDVVDILSVITVRVKDGGKKIEFTVSYENKDTPEVITYTYEDGTVEDHATTIFFDGNTHVKSMPDRKEEIFSEDTI